MKPVQMICKHNPEDDQYGDCFRTSIASILELEAYEVPHFMDHGDLTTFQDDIRAANKWLHTRGLALICFNIQVKMGKTLFDQYDDDMFFSTSSDYHFMVFGEKPNTGIGHVVVANKNGFAHDPVNSPTYKGSIILDPMTIADPKFKDVGIYFLGHIVMLHPNTED